MSLGRGLGTLCQLSYQGMVPQGRFERPSFPVESVAGIEPASRPWQGHVLPLNHTDKCRTLPLSYVPVMETAGLEPASPAWSARWGSNPRHPRWERGALSLSYARTQLQLRVEFPMTVGAQRVALSDLRFYVL